MFESRHQRLLTQEQFLYRFLKFMGISLLIVLGSLIFGAWGYSHYASLSWLDGFHAAAMILFSEGPVVAMTTAAAKQWEIIYSAYSGVAFFTIIGTFWAPVIHRFYHQFHLSVVDEQSNTDS